VVVVAMMVLELFRRDIVMLELAVETGVTPS
jgi:hypothetical protein